MKTIKFQKHDIAYIVNFNYPCGEVMSQRIDAIKVRIIDVKGNSIKGQTQETYGYIKKMWPGNLKNIVSKREKKKGKEIDFPDAQFVSVERTYKAEHLLTESEMKLAMIDYIMHDFQTEEEREFHFNEE